MNLRKEQEELEERKLSSHAVLSKNSKGRILEERECDVRTCFQRDRDRIIYSKAFRRLKHKTQVFISPEGDHYRTRLTHTLEVSQIARTIARGLRLNEDLTETIALGHDLGHTPFGHTGESVLNEICLHGFKHNVQSIRVVEKLEKKGKGLNLTWEVREGIKKHTGDEIPETLEGQIIRFADRIAYVNHDIEDAIRAEILSEQDIPIECTKVLGKSSSQRINTAILDIILNSQNQMQINMSDEVQEANDELRNFMFKNVYIDSVAKKDSTKAKNILEQLYRYFKDNCYTMPVEYLNMLNNNDIDRVVCDYIAGMTDRYAVKKFEDIFLLFSWV